MPYFNPNHAMGPRKMKKFLARRRAMSGYSGMGDFSSSSPCTTIPAGDPYRKPGNYCTTPSGGTVTFDYDGSTWDQSTTGAGTSSGSFLDSIGAALASALGQKPAVAPMLPVPVRSGLSTTTLIALAGGAVLLTVLLTRD